MTGWKETPIYLISFNNLNRGMRRLTDWLLAAGHMSITLLDNGSTWQPLLDYYESLEKDQRITIEHLGKNFGHEAPWIIGVQNRQSTRYIISDPDVVPAPECPVDLVYKMHEISDRHGPCKTGPGIRIDNLPDHYARKRDMLGYETGYWHEARRVDGDCFRADIDTTFALYEPGMAHWPQAPHYRLDYPYVVEHIPWYNDSSKPNPEREYYKATILPGINGSEAY